MTVLSIGTRQFSPYSTKHLTLSPQQLPPQPLLPPPPLPLLLPLPPQHHNTPTPLHRRYPASSGGHDGLQRGGQLRPKSSQTATSPDPTILQSSETGRLSS